MNTFLQEYGVIIVAVLVTITMIGVASIFGGNVQDGIAAVFTKFSDLVSNAVPTVVEP